MITTAPKLNGRKRDSPWCRTSHGGLPRCERIIIEIDRPYAIRPR